MFAADTNVVVRVLVGDDALQQKRAVARLRKILDGGGTVLIGTVVLAEVAWVLASAYSYERKQIAEALRGLTRTAPFVVAQRAHVTEAIDAYERGTAEFSDYLILALARADGCSTLLTFDRRLQKAKGCEAP